MPRIGHPWAALQQRGAGHNACVPGGCKVGICVESAGSQSAVAVSLSSPGIGAAACGYPRRTPVRQELATAAAMCTVHFSLSRGILGCRTTPMATAGTRRPPCS